jgi:hypothetical protein
LFSHWTNSNWTHRVVTVPDLKRHEDRYGYEVPLFVLYFFYQLHKSKAVAQRLRCLSHKIDCLKKGCVVSYTHNIGPWGVNFGQSSSNISSFYETYFSPLLQNSPSPVALRSTKGMLALKVFLNQKSFT